MVVGAPATIPPAARAGPAGIGVVGCGAGVVTDCADGNGSEGNCPAGSCAIAVSAITKKAVTFHLQIRMTLVLSLYPSFLRCVSQYASWNTTCTIAVESTAEPLRSAGLNRILLAAAIAASSSPCP